MYKYLAAILCFSALQADLVFEDYSDPVIWGAMGYPENYHHKDGVVKNRDDLIKKGLRIAEEKAEEGSELAVELLAGYYFENNEFQKAFFWAKKGTEFGSGDCMYILGYCYSKGNAVVKDLDEMAKWLILAKSAGHEYSTKLYNDAV